MSQTCYAHVGFSKRVANVKPLKSSGHPQVSSRKTKLGRTVILRPLMRVTNRLTRNLLRLNPYRSVKTSEVFRRVFQGQGESEIVSKTVRRRSFETSEVWSVLKQTVLRLNPLGSASFSLTTTYLRLALFVLQLDARWFFWTFQRCACPHRLAWSRTRAFQARDKGSNPFGGTEWPWR